MSAAEEIAALTNYVHDYHAPDHLDEYEEIKEARPPVALEQATLISSRITGAVVLPPNPFGGPQGLGTPSGIPGEPLHTIMLDLDVPARLVESSTKGHSHLYIDVPVGWSKYAQLLDLLADIGVLEVGYAAVSQRREATMLRLPWVKKPQ